MGVHIIAEFLGVEKRKMEKTKVVKSILKKAIKNSKLKVISSCFHQFKPFGVSGIYLLRESHLSIHTWPEFEYLALDIFTCGSEKEAKNAFEILKKEFKPKKVKMKILKREYEKFRKRID